ncbi:MAG: cobalamin-binding protein [Acidobacteria bacterium]|nr:cobalamin-binding protein [Acidobacteriota bacterium]
MKLAAGKQKFYFTSLRLGGKFSSSNSPANRAAVFALLMTLVSLFTNCKNEQFAPQASAPTREIADDLGRRVKVAQSVERAVSLAPNLTEIAFAVGAGNRLVGVTTYCDYPAEALQIQKIGDTINPNIETIIALKPQVVLVSTASQIETFTKQLEAQNIAVFVTNPNSMDDIYESIEKIGEIFGEREKARQINIDLQKRVAAVEAKIKAADKVKVFLQISKEPLVTVGKATFFNDLIERAGGASVTKEVESAYPKLSKETAFALNPDAIILSDSEDNREPNDVFKSSPAAKNGKIFRINADIISRPAPRIVDALEEMAKDLHPENFK